MEENTMNSDPIPGSWESLMSDLDEIANEYRGNQWEVFEIHPGDITLRIENNEPKIKILVADNEFPNVTDIDDELGFDSYEVYRAEDGGEVYLILAIENQTDRTVLLVPAHYSKDEDVDVHQKSLREQKLTIVLHRLDEESPLEFEFTEPSLIFDG
jgi:hypothetical protein